MPITPQNSADYWINIQKGWSFVIAHLLAGYVWKK
jgi:hypothetical protein